MGRCCDIGADARGAEGACEGPAEGLALEPPRLEPDCADGPCERNTAGALAEGPCVVRAGTAEGLEADGPVGANTGLPADEGAAGRAVFRGIAMGLLSPLPPDPTDGADGPKAGVEPPVTGLACPLGRKVGVAGA